MSIEQKSKMGRRTQNFGGTLTPSNATWPWPRSIPAWNSSLMRPAAWPQFTQPISREATPAAVHWVWYVSTKETDSRNVNDCSTALFWTSPELLRDPVPPRNGTQTGDVFSVGILFFNILCRLPPYQTDDYTALVPRGRSPLRMLLHVMFMFPL